MPKVNMLDETDIVVETVCCTDDYFYRIKNVTYEDQRNAYYTPIKVNHNFNSEDYFYFLKITENGFQIVRKKRGTLFIQTSVEASMKTPKKKAK